MNIQKKQKCLMICLRIVGGSMLVGAIIGITAKIAGIEDDALMKTSWEPTAGMIFGVVFLTCFFGMIKYLYDLDPGIQLRGKSRDQLTNILGDETQKIWHPKARELLDQMEHRTNRPS